MKVTETTNELSTQTVTKLKSFEKGMGDFNLGLGNIRSQCTMEVRGVSDIIHELKDANDVFKTKLDEEL